MESEYFKRTAVFQRANYAKYYRGGKKHFTDLTVSLLAWVWSLQLASYNFYSILGRSAGNCFLVLWKKGCTMLLACYPNNLRNILLDCLMLYSGQIIKQKNCTIFFLFKREGKEGLKLATATMNNHPHCSTKQG